MSESSLATAQCLFAQALDVVRGVAEAGSAGERVSVLRLCEAVARQLDQVTVAAVAGLDRDGVFAERGYRSAVQALGDLLGWEGREARRRVTAAEQVAPRTGLDGAVLPARLPATAEVFGAGRVGLRHVEVIARVLGGKTAGRLSAQQWAGAEEQLATMATLYSPRELQEWGRALVELLDQDGEAPDERPPALVNELFLSRLPGGGGTLRGRFDDAALFDAIATVIDARAKPLTADDDRSAGERQAEALAEVCGYVLDHGDVPGCGGHRPHVSVLIGLEDLENRARAACLDFGGPVAPQALRMLCVADAVL
jgi:5-methylcytosine-specific restriction protein A